MISSPEIPNLNATSALADFVCRTTPYDVPGTIRTKAVRHILDTLACGLAGATSQEAKACLGLMVAAQETGPVSVWGTGSQLSARSAALVNGVACHAFELDDTGGCDHSGAVVLPAALAAVALADRQVSGAEFVLAVILGYDVARRVLEACGGYGPHNDAGWHSTATCGTFGAAVAAARLLGLGSQATAHTIGHAASFSGGLWAFIHDGSQTKRIHAGRAAEGGLLAALLARSGVTGSSAVFEDKWGGFLSTFSPRSTNSDALTVGLGERWRIERVSLKPYASCRGTHSAIDALGDLLAENGLAADDVDRIDVRLSGFLHGMCGTRNIVTLAHAQMSLPYALAARLRLGHVGLDAYDDGRRKDPAVQAAMDSVTLTPDEALEPMDEPFVCIVTRDGRVFERRVTVPLGSPGNPMPDAAYFDKVRKLAGMALAGSQVERLITNVLAMEQTSDMCWLPESLAPFRD
jgi:2-methylcitrate dehydratase PrpD